MGASNDGTVRIRRPWAEELIWLAATVSIGLVVIVKLDHTNMLPIWVAYLVGYVAYNRRMGIDLTAAEAVVRRPYRRTKRMARAEVSGVAIDKGFVTLKEVGGGSTKLTVMNAYPGYGAERAERTRRQIQQWIDERPVAVAQMPGSASI